MTETTAPTDPAPPPPGRGQDLFRGLGALRRSRRPRTVAGVATGLARHLDIDPVVVKVLLVVLVFFGGAGLLVYGACWLVVPEEDTAGDPRGAIVDVDERSRVIGLAVVLVLAGLAVLGDTLSGFGFPWPLAVLGVVVLVVVLSRGERRGTTPAAWSPGPGVPWSTTSWDAGPRSARGWVGTAPTVELGKAAPARPQDPRAQQPRLIAYAVLLSMVVLGVLASLDLADLADLPVVPSAYPAAVLAVCGGLLVVGAWWGRTGGLVGLGVLAGLLTVALVLVPDHPRIGRLDATPTSAAAVAADYERSIGYVDLDLTDVVDPSALAGRTVEAHVGVGRLRVLVPPGLDVRIVSSVEVGDHRVFGEDRGNELDDPAAGDVVRDTGAAPELVLDLSVGVGSLEVEQVAP
ncbi:PspC domain-containing protein [Nocardioides sp.]|uniref:PspC domain-containing protein n=1 Tax=Nocardioides sp. TaxID=35761 RepID=UPI0035196D16